MKGVAEEDAEESVALGREGLPSILRETADCLPGTVANTGAGREGTHMGQKGTGEGTGQACTQVARQSEKTVQVCVCVWGCQEGRGPAVCVVQFTSVNVYAGSQRWSCMS